MTFLSFPWSEFKILEVIENGLKVVKSVVTFDKLQIYKLSCNAFIMGTSPLDPLDVNQQ